MQTELELEGQQQGEKSYASDQQGVREAARELTEQRGGPSQPEPVEITVQRPELLPDRIDEGGNNRGVDPKDAAHELRKYHEHLEREREEFKQAIAPEEAPSPTPEQIDAAYSLEAAEEEFTRERKLLGLWLQPSESRVCETSIGS